MLQGARYLRQELQDYRSIRRSGRSKIALDDIVVDGVNVKVLAPRNGGKERRRGLLPVHRMLLEVAKDAPLARQMLALPRALRPLAAEQLRHALPRLVNRVALFW